MSLIPTLPELLAIFERYNLAIWPMQVLAYALGLAALSLAIKPSRYSSRTIAGILSFLWLWIGVVFYPLYFAPAYPLASPGVLFIMQGALFLATVVVPRLSFGFRGGIYGVAGLLFVAYAMIGYPVVGYLLGHIYPQSPPFGLAPCPTTAFTFGLLLLTDKRVPAFFLIIPLLAALGAVTALSVGIFEDLGLIIGGALATAMILYRDRQAQD
jgi:hypothetical protein